MSAILFDAPCVRAGAETTTEIVTSYTDDGLGLPILVILGNYSVKLAKYRDRDAYEVEEIPSPLGRAFLLHRTPEVVAADPDHVERYGVLVSNPQDSLCECRGFEAHGRCKHVAALAALLAGGHIDHPMAGAPVEPFPSEQQVRDDALTVAPF